MLIQELFVRTKMLLVIKDLCCMLIFWGFMSLKLSYIKIFLIIKKKHSPKRFFQNRKVTRKINYSAIDIFVWFQMAGMAKNVDFLYFRTMLESTEILLNMFGGYWHGYVGQMCSYFLCSNPWHGNYIWGIDLSGCGCVSLRGSYLPKWGYLAFLIMCLSNEWMWVCQAKGSYGPKGWNPIIFFYVWLIDVHGCVTLRGSYGPKGGMPWIFLFLSHWWTWVCHLKRQLWTSWGNPLNVLCVWVIGMHLCVNPMGSYRINGRFPWFYFVFEALVNDVFRGILWQKRTFLGFVQHTYFSIFDLFKNIFTSFRKALIY